MTQRTNRHWILPHGRTPAAIGLELAYQLLATAPKYPSSTRSWTGRSLLMRTTTGVSLPSPGRKHHDNLCFCSRITKKLLSPVVLEALEVAPRYRRRDRQRHTGVEWRWLPGCGITVFLSIQALCNPSKVRCPLAKLLLFHLESHSRGAAFAARTTGRENPDYQ
ncbi:uncharacterized protein CLUP02_15661 [Colletotrichum lupini]|uniref:Uncharacterized protein n=1 Tax=Colletotrichum lupini TaxID=145971 RepID=A0A9Q8T7B3_9PEZI|nr:uncharacterized protein CLUP02_15661 [Colletotrichum lupini]UQC90130.1 hypothetical protein CLUP02_15661 [Colletotrichum lupini]